MNPYEEIMEHFGYRNQMKKLNEECYEFLEAVDNYEDMILCVKNVSDRDLKIAREFIIEEMGDILILITQFLVKYKITQEELDSIMDNKIKRTINRIDEKYYD